MPISAALRPMLLATSDSGISARQFSSRTGASVSRRLSRGALRSSTAQPAIATGTATGTKENIDRLTP